MRKVLEVIVTSAGDAIEAEAGGADRLELVRDLGVGGLTPDFDVVSAVLEAVRIPVRVMLREYPTMSVDSEDEMRRLQLAAKHFAQLPVDGIVMGFVRNGSVDTCALDAIFSVAPDSRFTFHRAFEELADAEAGIRQLKQFKPIDRILTGGGDDDWARRKARLIACQVAADPEISILVGAGLSPDVPLGFAQTPELREIHIGRAARARHSVRGPVKREAVRQLRNLLQ